MHSSILLNVELLWQLYELDVAPFMTFLHTDHDQVSTLRSSAEFLSKQTTCPCQLTSTLLGQSSRRT